MTGFDSGVASYIKAYAVVEVFFPVDDKGRADISCKQCPYYSKASRICRLNGRLIAYPETHVGQYCPLREIEEKET